MERTDRETGGVEPTDEREKAEHWPELTDEDPTVSVNRAPELLDDGEDEGDDDTTNYLSIQSFVTLWSGLLDGEPHAVGIVHRRDFALLYHNTRCRDLFVHLSGEEFAEALPADALAAVDAHGLWEGTSKPPRAEPLHAVVLGLRDHLGRIEGLYISWFEEEPQVPLHRPVPRQVLDHGSDLVVGIDNDDRIVYRNALARRFHAQEILGRSAPEVLHGSAMEAVRTERESMAELAIDLQGSHRMIRWRGMRINVGGMGPASPADLSATLALGRDVTVEHQASEQIRIRVQRLEAMHAISLAIGRGTALLEVYAMALVRLGEVIPHTQARLYRIDADETAIVSERVLRGVCGSDGGRARPLSESYSLADHPASEAVNRRVPVQRQTAGPAALRWPALGAAAEQGIRAVLSTPLLVDSRVVGVLWLASRSRGGFTQDDVEAAQEVAAQLANAIARQELIDQIARHNRELEQRVDDRTRELRSTQTQLLQAAKLSTIGEMASGLAHELNQPLNVVGGYIELLAEGALDEAGTSRSLEVMGGAVDRMSTLVAHLRNFSRVRAGDSAPVDLRDIVHMARELSARASRRPVEVHFDRPDREVVVLGDSNRLEQLLINLIANAMQATDEAGGSSVRVALRNLPSGEVAVEVTDQGPGVPRNLHERVFEPFFTTKPKGSGTGLGLSISSKIAQDHGGRITVHDAEGGGATFRVTLPKPPH